MAGSALLAGRRLLVADIDPAAPMPPARDLGVSAAEERRLVRGFVLNQVAAIRRTQCGRLAARPHRRPGGRLDSLPRNACRRRASFNRAPVEGTTNIASSSTPGHSNLDESILIHEPRP